jgi:hypothetical protein
MVRGECPTSLSISLVARFRTRPNGMFRLGHAARSITAQVACCGGDRKCGTRGKVVVQH